MLQKNIAFFDFDGTITTKDTMLEFAKYCHSTTNYLLGMVLISPWLIAMKAGLVSKQKAKEKFITYFFGNTSVQKFSDDCNLFTKDVLAHLIKADALQTIKKFQAENTEVVIVSASAENWLAPWCIEQNIIFLCSKLEVKENKITGKLLGQNCNGLEKVNRIKQQFDTASYENIYCYGDTDGDKPMLGLATRPYYRLFVR
jgi:phosphatidylglycerophosphatase C